MADVLISANGYEPATRYGLHYARKMALTLDHSGHNVAFIEDGSAYDIDTELMSGGYEFFYHLGHGCDNITTTYNYEDLYWVKGSCGETHQHDDNYVGVLPEKKVMLLSCSCGKRLVPYIGSLGGIIGGYAEDFMWVALPPYEPEGPDDKYSKWFFEPANTFFIRLVEGDSPDEAYRKTINEFLNSIEYWETQDDPYAPVCVNLLLSNMRSFVVFYNNNRLSLSSGTKVYDLLLYSIPAVLLYSLYKYHKR